MCEAKCDGKIIAAVACTTIKNTKYGFTIVNRFAVGSRASYANPKSFVAKMSSGAEVFHMEAQRKALHLAKQHIAVAKAAVDHVIVHNKYICILFQTACTFTLCYRVLYSNMSRKGR